MGRKGQGAGTQCDAGRWSKGKSGRGKREKTKKESGTRGRERFEFASDRARNEMKRPRTAPVPALPSHQSLNPLHWELQTATRPGSVSIATRRSVTSQARFAESHRPHSRLHSDPTEGQAGCPGRSRPVHSSPHHAPQCPVSMPSAGGASIRVNRSSSSPARVTTNSASFRNVNGKILLSRIFDSSLSTCQPFRRTARRLNLCFGC
jgi:hypothetical protein